VDPRRLPPRQPQECLEVLKPASRSLAHYQPPRLQLPEVYLDHPRPHNHKLLGDCLDLLQPPSHKLLAGCLGLLLNHNRKPEDYLDLQRNLKRSRRRVDYLEAARRNHRQPPNSRPGGYLELRLHRHLLEGSLGQVRQQAEVYLVVRTTHKQLLLAPCLETLEQPKVKLEAALFLEGRTSSGQGPQCENYPSQSNGTGG
jgi:hypothetical protein